MVFKGIVIFLLCLIFACLSSMFDKLSNIKDEFKKAIKEVYKENKGK